MDVDAGPLTLRDYLSPVLARRWWILAFVVAMASVSYGFTASKHLVYTASTKLYVGQQGNAALGVGAGFTSDRTIADQAALITTTDVASIVAKQIGYRGSPGQLAAGVTAVPAAGSDLIAITAHESTSVAAAKIANGFAQAFLHLSSAQGQAAIAKSLAELRQQLKQLPKGVTGDAQRTNIDSQIQQLQVASTSGIGNATQIDPATPPAAPSTRPSWEVALFAALAAAIAGVLLSYVLQRLDPRVKTVMHALEIYDRPVLATVTEDEEISSHLEEGLPALPDHSREIFRELRINLDLAGSDRGFNTIIVTSASPGEGKSSIARNLALAFIEAGRSVALVDADLRKPTLHKAMGVKIDGGLTEVVAGLKTLDEVIRMVPVADSANVGAGDIKITGSGELIGPNGGTANGDGQSRGSVLTLVPAGKRPPNPPAILESPRFRMLLTEVAQAHDVVVLDTPPLTVVSDVIPVLGSVDAVLLVVRSGVTDARSARHAAEIIARVPDANFVGIAVNGLPLAEAAAYGSGYGYRYYWYGKREVRESYYDGKSSAPEPDGADAEAEGSGVAER